MKQLKTISAVAVAAFLLTAGAASADEANGTYQFDAGSYVPLWDLSGTYSPDVWNVGDLDVTILAEPSGKFTGSGTFFARGYLMGDNVDLLGTSGITGTVSGSSANPKVAMAVDTASTGEVEGYVVSDFTEAVKLNLTLDGIDEWLTGSGTDKTTITAQNPSTGKLVAKTSSDLVEGVDIPLAYNGDWGLTLIVTPNGNKLTGTASVATAGGTMVDFKVTGTYSPKTDTSALTLTGTGSGAGTSLTVDISTLAGNISIKSIKGKLFGQTLAYQVPK